MYHKWKPISYFTLSAIASASQTGVQTIENDNSFWIALFGLGTIGVFALYLSSNQIKKIKKEYKKIRAKQKEIEKKQSLLLEQMGEKIHNAAQENVNNEKRLLDTPIELVDTQEIKNRVIGFKKNDEDLLRTTYEMIDFLKIKSGNILIKQEAFQLSNMLHKLTNAVAPIIQAKEHMLYYEIEPDVTRYLIGDTDRIYQVLHNLMVDILGHQNYTEVTLYIKIEDDERLVFVLNNNILYLTPQEIDTLFIPTSWIDVHKKQKEVDFFVLNELIDNMHGKLSIQSHEAKGTQYQLSLPYIKDLDNKTQRDGLIKGLSNKRALVVDSDLHAAKILIDILHNFGIDVLFKSSENLKIHKPNVKDIDFIVLKSKDISYKVTQFFNDMDEKHSPEVIVVHEINEKNENVEKVSLLADAILHSPLIVGDVEEVLKQLYLQKTRRKKEIQEEKIQNFKINKVPKVGIQDFQKFKDKTILIAENNFVSQEVLSSILGASHLTILKAENGQEVLDMIENDTFDIDLIFMDMSMPILDGFDTTREIRQNSKYKKVPIAAVTSLGFTYEVEQMVLSGVDACIIKPYRMGHIYTALERFLESSDAHALLAKTSKHPKYRNKNILDVEKGFAYVGNSSFYDEIVVQILLALKYSDVLVKDMIQQDKIDELRAFCVDALGLSSTIGSIEYAALVKEMLMAMQEKDAYLSKYITLYKEKWLALEYEMKHYLKQ